MEAKVGVFGRGMTSVKIQYFADGRPYGMFKARACHYVGPALLGGRLLTVLCMLCMALSRHQHRHTCASHVCCRRICHMRMWLLAGQHTACVPLPCGLGLRVQVV